MLAKDIKKIGVLGCGLMGSGIAQVCAQAGLDTVVLEKAQEPLDRGLKIIEKSLGKMVEKGKVTAADKDQITRRLKPTLKLEELKDRDFIIEAISEDLDEKIKVLRRLDELCRKEVVFASNTSS